MAAEMICFGQVEDDAFTPTENLHRQAGQLCKWSKALLKRTAKAVGSGETKSQQLLSPEEERCLLSELREHRHELEMKNDELRWLKEELEVSLAQYFDLYDLAPEGYFTLSSKGLILKSNLAAATLLGVRKEALVKQPISNFIFCEEQDIYHQQCQQLFNTGVPQVAELKMLRADASLFWARLKTTTAPDADGKPVCRVVMSDISDQKRVEEELREREEKYRMVADFTHDWEFWLGPDESILYCSPSCQRITGQSAAAFERDPSLLRRLVHPDDLASYDQHRHGLKTLKNHEEIEFRIIHADGSVRWISHVCRPVYNNATGQYLGTRGSNRDVTERKSLEAEGGKARNLESIGTMVGGIAHDFNNLLQGLLGNLSLARRSLPAASEAFHYLKQAENVYAQAAKLTSQLLVFSTGGGPRRVELQLAKYLRKAVAATLSGSELTVEFDLADDLWPVNIDPSQFPQVIDNMVTNARDAMPLGGRIRITAENEQLPGGRMANTLPPGSYVKISIQDQGCGISKDDLPRIFDPYFSTKPRCAKKGVGLGLSLCNTIIQKNGGAITVETAPGQGATFHVFLPAAVNASENTAVTKELAGNGPRILIMDDEASVTELATKYLNHYGYQVDSAANGDAAVAAYQEALEADAPYAAVILDLMIPGGMGGKEVFSILKKTDPEVKAIVSSGYTTDPAMLDFAVHGFVEVLVKPYQLNKMKEVLDRLV